MRHAGLPFDGSREFAEQMDRDDPLRAFRERFFLPENTAYLCGNCLGMQPRSTTDYLQEVLAGWSHMGFRAHFNAPHDWLSYEQRHLVGPMAEILGALPSETSLMNSLSVNLHLMMISFFRPEAARRKILIEDGAFPSDQFVLQSQLRLHGLSPDDSLEQIGSRSPSGLLDPRSIVSLIEERGHEFSLILLGNPSFRNGQVLDIEAITDAGHRRGCVVGFDLAHAVGNIELRLHEWDVDFAVWCNYKYMNAGPGSVGGCFVHERHAAAQERQRLEGWWGNRLDSRFNMGTNREFDAIRGAQGWQLSSPPILSMAALRASLEIFAEAGMANLRCKSMRMGDYLQDLLDTRLPGDCESRTPRDAHERGCQFTLKVRADARDLQRWLLERRIVVDVHGADLIRVAPVPLYNTYAEIYLLVDRLAEYARDPARPPPP